jgi:phospholipid/cholesterol/gamma-HCH transport system permease protein
MRRSESEAAWQVERTGEAVRLAGFLRTADGSQIIDAFRNASAGFKTVPLDLADAQQLDVGVVMLLLDEVSGRGGRLTLVRGDRFRPLFNLCMEGCAWQWKRTRAPGLVEQVGIGTVRRLEQLDQVFEFVGEMSVATARVGGRARRVHWGEIPLLVERAGVDALPILVVINFLVGLVTAFSSTRALEMFGANVLVAGLVSISMTRQLGPLMTAIVVCGRTGAAITAELGSMKVSEEIDALRTLGLEPFGWLVLPRVIALVLVMPVLTLVADVVGILGGLVVAVTSLGLTPRIYLDQMRQWLVAWDIQSGVWMSVAFALAIGFIACQQGLATTGGAEDVGRRTTNTVVDSLFAIIFLDAVLTLFYRALGLI